MTAKNLLQLALEKDPKYIHAHYALGNLYYTNALYIWDHDKNDDFLRKPKDVIKSDAQLAKKEFQTILELAKQPEDEALGYFGLGMVRIDEYSLKSCADQNVQEFNDSKKNFESAIAADPDYYAPSFGLAYALELQREFDEAIEAMASVKRRTKLTDSVTKAADKYIEKLVKKRDGGQLESACIEYPDDFSDRDDDAADDWGDYWEDDS